ncbi:HAD superfamily hydrolase (TIGR01509 family) [Nocardia tenerifensis]|uniref:HAD superfamily hydrolase (TIGR01509 family) n=1 Tax=Nocardia tenerifensis TaxID=228006 RepID=A0A318JW19_9NOCA|nr:HAD family phosphatase [Nocardia tenerifensis]PXX58689.1 HAD superfamily hydrolase (TIGR01509 family) [Nocardia tenerifensis]
MNAESPVRAVVFDMDGLLIDSESLAMESLVSAGAELGYEMPIDFCRSMIGVPADRCRTLAAAAYGRGFPLDEYFDLHDEHLRRLVDGGRLATKPGAVALLDALDAQGVPKAIATSSSRERADHHLELAGLAGRFDAVVTRQDVTKGKPDPEPYLKAMAALGGEAETTLALEDSTNGLRAACAAGLRCILVPDLVQPTEESRRLAHRLYPDLHRVIEYLAAANAPSPAPTA